MIKQEITKKKLNKNLDGRDVNGCEEGLIQSAWHPATLLRCIPARVRRDEAFVPALWWVKAFLRFHSFISVSGHLENNPHWSHCWKKKTPQTFCEIWKGRVSQFIPPGVTHHPSGPSGSRSPWRAPGFPGLCLQPFPSASALPGWTPVRLVSPPSSWSQTGSAALPAVQRRSFLCLPPEENRHANCLFPVNVPENPNSGKLLLLCASQS